MLDVFDNIFYDSNIKMIDIYDKLIIKYLIIFNIKLVYDLYDEITLCYISLIENQNIYMYINTIRIEHSWVKIKRNPTHNSRFFDVIELEPRTTL